MKDQIEKQAIEEMRKDLIEIFDEEYEKRRLITPQNTAEKMTVKGYSKQEWISVEERLPEEVYGKHRKRISVLVCTESGKISTASRQRAFHFDKNKLVWVELDTFDWSGRKHITHWTPLPEPPKMKGGAE